MPAKDYYHILGLQRTATHDDVKKAYRTLAKKHHPDANGGGNDSQFKEITEAYEVLSNPEKRAQYDHMGSFAHEANRFNYSYQDSLFNIFSQSFFQGGMTFGKKFSLNRKIMLQIRLDQAYLGFDMTFDVNRTKECHSCSGSGSVASVGAKCDYCNGNGRVRSGMLACTHCRGTGMKQVVCSECNGAGGVGEIVKMTMSIPKGIRTGTSLITKGEGNIAVDGKKGDLIVVVSYAPSFGGVECLSNGSLIKQENVPWDAALMGEEFSFRLFSTCPSDNKITLDSALPNGWVYVIKGGGMGGDGDLLIKVLYELPTNINDKSRKAIARAIRDAKPSGAG